MNEAVSIAKNALAMRQDPTKGGAPINLADWSQVYPGIRDLVRAIGVAIVAEYVSKHSLKTMPVAEFEAELFKACDPIFGSLTAFDGSRSALTAREYMNLFSDYEQFNRKPPSTDPLQKALREIVELAKRQEDLRRIIETGTGFDRYGYAKLTSVAEANEELKRVNRELAEADRTSGISNYIRRDPHAKATALDRLKKSMKAVGQSIP